MVCFTNDRVLDIGNCSRRQVALHEKTGEAHGTGPLGGLPVRAALRGASGERAAAPAPFAAIDSGVAAGDVCAGVVVERLADAGEAIGCPRVTRQSKDQGGVRYGDAAVTANAAIAAVAAVAPI